MSPVSVSPDQDRDLHLCPGGLSDLHTHTTASDGRLTPIELVSYAKKKGLVAFGICDHDTVEGMVSLYAYHSDNDILHPLIVDGIEIVPGVEFNCFWEDHEIHILGFYAPLFGGPLAELLANLRHDRVERVRESVVVLGKMGMPVDFDRVMELSGPGSVGRPHIARAMVEKGYVSSVKEAFDVYIGLGKPAYVHRERLTPHAAIGVITSAGGVAVWAHPGTSQSLHLLPDFVSCGLSGIEAHHPDHGPDMERRCLELAREHQLIITGGSDFHGIGSGEGGDLGSTVVPYSTVLAIRGLALTRR